MRAIRCRFWGEPETLGLDEVTTPPLQAGQVRILVHAAGVNYADVLMIGGKFHHKPAFPFSPGLELAGVISEVAADVRSLRPGQRVLALVADGAFAEEAVAAAGDVIVLPDAMEFAIAAGFARTYGAAWIGLVEQARLRPGEVLLVHGVSGGVALAALDVGKALGATVIASAGTADKVAVAAAGGADHAMDYVREDIREQVRILTDGRGVDVVFDPIGGEVFERSLRSCAWGARLIMAGFESGRAPQIQGNLLFARNAAVFGLNWDSCRERAPMAVSDGIRTLLGWFAEDRLRPHTAHRFDLAEAPQALRLLADRTTTGKVVLTTGRDR
ncbi:MAG: zinc-binding dehydrogenase [Azospirillum sp.]|nr:zinc-binding dehydrogenase [Azospirillum sp.]